LFCGKKSYSVILSLRNIPSMQHYVILILRHSRLARKTRESLRVFSRVFRAFECRKISNLSQHTRNVTTAQNYNSRKFGLNVIEDTEYDFFAANQVSANCEYTNQV